MTRLLQASPHESGDQVLNGKMRTRLRDSSKMINAPASSSV